MADGTTSTRGLRSIASPRYHQVYVTLRTWVRDGTYRPGDRIPTEPQLCEMFDVSRITVRKAIDNLCREGWLVRQQGRGTFVQLSASRAAAAVDLDQVRKQVAGLAAATEVSALNVAEVMPDDETRAALALAEGELVQRASHVRALHGAPLGLITTFVPVDIAKKVEVAEMARQPMFELLRMAGIPLARADQYIGATLAGVEAARALEVEVGAPLLRLTRTVFDLNDRPVERVVALYRADAYQYHMHLEARG
ncbi:MAG: GntR family transcriptional regulator [Gammaproteobacteria bacterium]|nr:GntR family transcriptional regulator [Gammaproteobacteria bacterium]